MQFRENSSLFQDLVYVMIENKIPNFLSVFVVMEQVEAFIAVEAGIFGVSLAARRHPGGGEGVARATTQSVRAQHVVHDGVTSPIEAVVRGQESHVGKDEEMLAVSLMQIDVRLTQSYIEVDEARFRHVRLFEVTQPLLFRPFDDGLAVVDRVR